VVSPQTPGSRLAFSPAQERLARALARRALCRGASALGPLLVPLSMAALILAGPLLALPIAVGLLGVAFSFCRRGHLAPRAHRHLPPLPR
jgi:hypothetical protein